MYKDTITLYNRYVESGAVKWQATVFTDVDFNADTGRMRQLYGETSKDTARLHIRFTGDVTAPIVGGKAYCTPKAFSALSDKSGAFTLQSGNNFDFFVIGAEIVSGAISDDDYPDGFYNYKNKTTDGCYAVSSVAIYSVIPHFEVLAR